jgi:hydrogenase nickel incorporation protein HypA/HybF
VAEVHELSIVLGLIDAVAEAAPAGQLVSVIHLRIGALSGISPTALDFAYQLASVGTVADGARLEIETVPVRLNCQPCQRVVEATQHSLCCPECHTPSLAVVSGRELEIAWIEVDEPAVSAMI